MNDFSAQKALWLAVIGQAINDALVKPDGKKVYSHQPNRLVRAQARSFLNLRCDNFLEVCGYADISPEYVLKEFRRIEREHKEGSVRVLKYAENHKNRGQLRKPYKKRIQLAKGK